MRASEAFNQTVATNVLGFSCAEGWTEAVAFVTSCKQRTEYVGRRHLTPYFVHRLWPRRICPVTASARDSKSVRLNCHSMALRVNSPLGQFARNRPVLWYGVLVPRTCRALAEHSIFIGDTSTICLEIRGTMQHTPKKHSVAVKDGLSNS